MPRPYDRSVMLNNHVAFYLPNLDGGGAERAVLAVANGFAMRGISVDLVLGMAIGPYIIEVDSVVNVVSLNTQGRLRTIWRLMRYLQRNRPAVIMSAMDLPNVQTVLASRLAGFKGRLIVSQRAVINAIYRNSSFFTRVAYLIGIRFTYPLASMIVSNSDSATQELVKGFGIAADRVVTINNQIDSGRIDRLAKEDLTFPWNDENKVPLLIAVGSLTARKDMATVIRAFALVRTSRPARLVILGEGTQRGNLEALIIELGISDYVRLLGFDVNPYKWISKADILVSASRAEGFPNVIAEALALGKQVVATNCPGDTSKLLGVGQWGRLVGVGDAREMASAICDCLSVPIKSDLLKSRAKDFSPERTVDAYLAVLLPRFVLRSHVNDKVP